MLKLAPFYRSLFVLLFFSSSISANMVQRVPTNTPTSGGECQRYETVEEVALCHVKHLDGTRTPDFEEVYTCKYCADPMDLPAFNACMDGIDDFFGPSIVRDSSGKPIGIRICEGYETAGSSS